MNYITGKHISRRTMLQGMGAAVGLPLLDAYGVKATFYVLDSANATTAK